MRRKAGDNSGDFARNFENFWASSAALYAAADWAFWQEETFGRRLRRGRETRAELVHSSAGPGDLRSEQRRGQETRAERAPAHRPLGTTLPAVGLAIRRT